MAYRPKFRGSRSALVNGRLSVPQNRSEPNLITLSWEDLASHPELVFGVDFGQEKLFTLVPDGAVSQYLDLDALFVRRRSPKLLVVFHGALDREEFTLPRWEYRRTLKEFDGSVLFVQDPTLYAHEKLTLGWYVGTQTDNAHHMIVRLINQASALIEPKQVLLTGSSGGGFAALAVSARIPNSSALVFSPQTSIENYYVGHRRRLMSSAFPLLMPTMESLTPFEDRLDMGALYSKGTSNRVFYLQNTGDPYHIKNHLLPFMRHAGLDLAKGDMRNERLKVECRYLRDGHGGPRPNQLRLYVNRVFEGGF